MEALLKKVQEKANLTEEQAKGAVDSVMEFVKSKLPEGLADKVDDMFGGAEGEKVEFGGIMDSLAGLFGGAKDAASGAADKAEDALGDAKDKAGEMFEEGKEKLEDLAEDAEEMAKDAINKIKGMFGGDKK